MGARFYPQWAGVAAGARAAGDVAAEARRGLAAVEAEAARVTQEQRTLARSASVNTLQRDELRGRARELEALAGELRALAEGRAVVPLSKEEQAALAAQQGALPADTREVDLADVLPPRRST
ncbi:MAG: hypothetical protein HY904_14005 [Deltaproteobacteria bacterium]|nr:hypothetical protein [Deltaproteobacteria bacterium]